MSVQLADFPGTGTFAGGVHPLEHKKLSEHKAVEVLPVPEQVFIPLLQHTGAACEPIVKLRQEVTWGEKVGDSKAFISSPVHASVNGAVGMFSVATLPNGRHVKTIPIKTGANPVAGDALIEDIFGGEWPTTGLDAYAPEKIAETVREAGIVGMGGAAFPSHVKLGRNEKRPVDTILVNGCECEPYLTSDYRLMVEFPEPIVAGALLAARAAGAKQIIVAIEDNKPAAVETMVKAVAGTGIQVAVLETRYPMGGEKQTVRAVLKRTIPTGGLPLDVGVVVINVGTATAMARAVLRGKPLTHRIVSVTGSGIIQPKNVLTPIGATYADVIKFCGGLKPETMRVVAGGPMMGFTLGDLNVPVTKGTSGIVAMTSAEIRQPEELTCIRCGRCVDVCPVNLVPTRLALASRHQDWDLARRYHIAACMECGCCAYVCPSGIPLVQLIRVGKAKLAKA